LWTSTADEDDGLVMVGLLTEVSTHGTGIAGSQVPFKTSFSVDYRGSATNNIQMETYLRYRIES